MSSTRIPLYVSNQKAYCWDAQDVATLRVTYRICGLPTGTLPGVSQQNLFLGLPLVFMPEEVVLLVENGACCLIDSPNASSSPTSNQIAQHTALRLQDIETQQSAAALAAQQRKIQVEQTLEASSAVQKKREQRKKEKAAIQNGGEKGQEGLFGESVGEEPVIAGPGGVTEDAIPIAEESKSASTPPQPPQNRNLPYFSTVPATSTSRPFFNPSSNQAIYHDLPSAAAANVWNYPRTELERARCESFRHVWGKGMYLGQGVKFGGEFLVYPGDPLRYHSHFVTTTLSSPSTVIRPLELLAWGRLGTATKKAHLLCCYDGDKKKEKDETSGDLDRGARNGGEEVQDEGEVECYSLEWGNFG